MTINFKNEHLGYFGTPEEAHEAYCEIGKAIYGEFFYSGVENV
jgi:hypothetical protein